MNELIQRIQSAGLDEERAGRSAEVFLHWVQVHFPLSASVFQTLMEKNPHNFEELRNRNGYLQHPSSKK
ncbi:MAG TPA: hypothetical protein VHK69_06385 [Chitinophagaceae bacterium]|jgi:hypothetical protein|nr:hypothetical protein [Chitinophagaceae bacterium]